MSWGQKARLPPGRCGNWLMEGGTHTARELQGRVPARVSQCAPEPLGHTTTPRTMDVALQTSGSSVCFTTLLTPTPCPVSFCTERALCTHKACIPSQGDQGRPQGGGTCHPLHQNLARRASRPPCAQRQLRARSRVFLWRALSGASSHPQQCDVISRAARAYWSDSRS